MSEAAITLAFVAVIGIGLSACVIAALILSSRISAQEEAAERRRHRAAIYTSVNLEHPIFHEDAEPPSHLTLIPGGKASDPASEPDRDSLYQIPLRGV